MGRSQEGAARSLGTGPTLQSIQEKKTEYLLMLDTVLGTAEPAVGKTEEALPGG